MKEIQNQINEIHREGKRAVYIEAGIIAVVFIIAYTLTFVL